MINRLLIATLVVFGWGCSGAYESAAMKLKYQPARGVSFVEEQAGPPRVARFSHGLQIRSVDSPPPAIEADKLEALLGVVSPETKGQVISARVGSITAGQVVRFAVKDVESRSLVFYIPRAHRYLVVALTAPEARFGDLENQFELSLGSLRVHD